MHYLPAHADNCPTVNPDRRTWSEVRASGTRPKGRYGHGLALLAPTASHPVAGGNPAPPSAAADPRALVFGGECAAGAVNDLFVLRGLAPPPAASAAAGGAPPKAPQPAWTPLEASGPAPAARKGHAVAGDNAQRTKRTGFQESLHQRNWQRTAAGCLYAGTACEVHAFGPMSAVCTACALRCWS